jgi:thiol-disulfide isomerase/thioredoxin
VPAVHKYYQPYATSLRICSKSLANGTKKHTLLENMFFYGLLIFIINITIMQIITQAEFANAISKGAVVIDYFAERCPPCKALTPMLEDVQKQLGDRISIYKIDVDKNQELTTEQ